VRLARVTDFATLGAEWEALEAESDFGVFQGWGWIGCLAEERYDDPWLLRAEAGGRTLGLALFNRRRGALHLAESGDAAKDRPFIEHNAPLVARDAPPGLAAAMLAEARRATGRLVLGGVAPALAAAAGGARWRWEVRPAPFLDLDALRASGGDLLARLSANTRQQLRRAERRAGGPLALEAATTPGAAADFLDEMIPLHERRWHGQGAFCTPWLARFHAALVRRLAARGEVEMLRVTAGGQLVGLLENFRCGGVVHAYQSGFAETGGDPAQKPGLLCHLLAIRRALAEDAREYDLMAGAQRYKQSLARESRDLLWAELVPRASWRGVAAALRGAGASLTASLGDARGEQGATRRG
jgi:CelD/BcsL family acetyltransferase involved in cellulose biosynthesis